MQTWITWPRFHSSTSWTLRQLGRFSQNGSASWCSPKAWLSRQEWACNPRMIHRSREMSEGELCLKMKKKRKRSLRISTSYCLEIARGRTNSVSVYFAENYSRFWKWFKSLLVFVMQRNRENDFDSKPGVLFANCSSSKTIMIFQNLWRNFWWNGIIV